MPTIFDVSSWSRLTGSWVAIDGPANFQKTLLVRWQGSIWTGDNNDIPGRMHILSNVSKWFPDSSFPCISNDSISDTLTCRNSESAFLTGSGGDKNNEMMGYPLTTLALNRKKLATLAQTRGTRKCIWSNWCFRTEGHLLDVETATALRPLRRRALSMRCPDLVAILARKPCVRWRFRLLGWNVRFIVNLLEFSVGY